MAPAAEHAQDAASTTIDMQWALDTLKKAATLQKEGQGKAQQIMCKRDGQNESVRDADWLEVRALSSLVFGTAIGLVHNADLNDDAKMCFFKSMARGHRAIKSAIHEEYRGTDIGKEDFQKFAAHLDEAVALCAHLVLEFEQKMPSMSKMVYDDGKMIRATLWPVTMVPG